MDNRELDDIGSTENKANISSGGFIETDETGEIVSVHFNKAAEEIIRDNFYRKYYIRFRDEFDERYGKLYSEMKDFLRRKLGREPHMPISNEEMWEYFINLSLEGRKLENLEREHFLMFDNFIGKKLDKALKSKNERGQKENIQVGRPEDFSKEKSLKWFNELKQQKEYQHDNGKPHKTRIREEIIKRHTRVEDGQTIKPSMRQIRRHT
ncbi:MAG TPA: hypothetical protein VJ964_00015 [Balneolaceae bacterium]|nr:hypothetical protein [Balneolaceae bacterium]